MKVSLQFNPTDNVCTQQGRGACTLRDVDLGTAIAISMALRNHPEVEPVIVVSGRPAAGPLWSVTGWLHRVLQAGAGRLRDARLLAAGLAV